MEHKEQTHVVPFSTFLFVWIALLILTGLTLAASFVHLGSWNVVLALAIAMLKASLVVLYFMHLRYESLLFQGMFFVCLFTVTVIIVLTFTDYMFR